MSLLPLVRSWELRAKEFAEKWQNVKPAVIEPHEDTNPYDTFFQIEEIWNDITPTLDANNFYALSIIGAQGSGKTTIAGEFAKLALEKDYRVVYAQPDDWLNDITGWRDRVLAGECRAANCFVIDDLSYSTDENSRKSQAQLKSLIARIRHVFSGKVLVIYVTHRLHAAPPMLRNGKTWIFSDMQAADRDDAQEVIGRSKTLRESLESLFTFISRAALEGARTGQVKYKLNDNDFIFNWGKEDTAGDGRLMAAFHGGRLGVYVSKLTQPPINFDLYRYVKPEIDNTDG
jgi:hypothetical protein